MQLPEICIKRPVFATVLSLVIVLLGLISYQRLPVREYPRIDEPVVSVSTTYRGASAEVVESQVTKILEDSLAGIEGVEVMTSQSRSETSRINVRFNLKRDPDSAAADVRDKVARVRAKMPDTIDEPVIAKVEADSQPIIYIAVEAGSLSAIEASDYVHRYVQPRLSVLPGASDVRVFGERQVSTIYSSAASYYVILETANEDRQFEDALSRLSVRSKTGQLVQLSSVATVKRTVGPIAVNHQGQLQAITLSFNLAPDAPLGDATPAIEQMGRDMKLPASIITKDGGDAAVFQDSQSSQLILIVAAVGVI